jgi:hypothetical protein
VAACVEAGGSAEECREAALQRCRAFVNEFLERCGLHCDEEPDPEETCADRCIRLRDAIVAECVAAGGVEADCTAEGDAFLTRCNERCDEPEPPDRCSLDCEAGAQAIAERCAAAGSDAAECQERAAAFRRRCEEFQEEHCTAEIIARDLAPRDMVRGDANSDLEIDIADPVTILSDLFQGQHLIVCPDAADANDDGENDISDAIRLLLRLFAGGPPLPEPAVMGVDMTADDLFCE